MEEQVKQEGTGREAGQEEEEQQLSGKSGEIVWMSLLMNAAVSAALIVTALLAYHQMFVLPNKQRVAVLDVAEVLQLKELQLTVQTSKPGITDAERGEAYESIKKFAQDIEAGVAQLQEECGCLVFVKNAVVKAPTAEDLTPRLKEMLGLDKITKEALVAQLRSTGGSGTPPQTGPGAMGPADNLTGGAHK